MRMSVAWSVGRSSVIISLRAGSFIFINLSSTLSGTLALRNQAAESVHGCTVEVSLGHCNLELTLSRAKYNSSINFLSFPIQFDF